MLQGAFADWVKLDSEPMLVVSVSSLLLGSHSTAVPESSALVSCCAKHEERSSLNSTRLLPELGEL